MLAQFALHGRLVELLSSSSPCSVFVELSLWRGSLYILRGPLVSKSFVFVLLLAIGGLCGLALLTRDLKVGSGEIRERRSQLKNGVRIQTRKPKLGTTTLRHCSLGTDLQLCLGTDVHFSSGLLKQCCLGTLLHCSCPTTSQDFVGTFWHCCLCTCGLGQRVFVLVFVFVFGNTCRGTTPHFWVGTLRQTGRELVEHCCLKRMWGQCVRLF